MGKPAFLLFSFFFTIVTAGKKPNVVIILTDDQGYGDVGRHGNSKLHTPYLDQMYDESLRFTNFHVDPTCSPTRAALLTGRYSHRVGTWHTISARHFLRDDETTMAEVFKQNGYKTGIFGKWHLGDSYPYRPQDRGFEVSVIHKAGAIGQASDYWGNTYFDPVAFVDGEPTKLAGFCTDIWFSKAIEFIEKNKKQKFFVFIPTNTAHEPLTPKSEDLELYSDTSSLSPSQKKFYALITNIDTNVGKLNQALKDHDVYENTIVIFMTDNGSGVRAYNAGLSGYKSSILDGGHRVPFFMQWPKQFKEARDVNHLASHIDILPTLMDKSFCKLKYSIANDRSIDGTNLAPIILKNEFIQRTLVVESQRVLVPEKWRYTAVMMNDNEGNDWRLVNNNEGQVKFRLNNMVIDTSQSSNVIGQYPSEFDEMVSYYNTWWNSVSTRDDYISPIFVGGKEDTVVLAAIDWMGAKEIPFLQKDIEGLCTNGGYWRIRVDEAGKYAFEARKLPKESQTEPNDEEVEFSLGGRTYNSQDNTLMVELEKGEFDFTAHFNDGSKTCAALYVYVSKGEFPDTPSEPLPAEPDTPSDSSKYTADWDSLSSLPIPNWLSSSKFGIFIHWGAYSVEGRVFDSPVKNYMYTEWLPHFIYKKFSKYEEILGQPLSYANMIEQFTAKKFKAKEWMKIIKNSGAKYVVPVAEHHDGFAMWDSELTEWDAKDIGPKVDVVGELAAAARSAGLKFGVSFHRERQYWYYGSPYPEVAAEIEAYPERAGLYGPYFELSESFLQDYEARINELVAKYTPDYLWFDGFSAGSGYNDFRSIMPRIISNYVNDAIEKGVDPYVNNKSPVHKSRSNFPAGVGVISQDNLRLKAIPDFLWENPATLGRSYGYAVDEEESDSYKSVEELVWLLTDTVSKNGTLLLNIGPKSDGTIAPNQQRRLEGIGEWLEANGDCIYDTVPWNVFGYDDVRFTVNLEHKIVYVVLKELSQSTSEITLYYTKNWDVGSIKQISYIGKKGRREKLAYEFDKRLQIQMPTNLDTWHNIVFEIELSVNPRDLPVKK